MRSSVPLDRFSLDVNTSTLLAPLFAFRILFHSLPPIVTFWAIKSPQIASPFHISLIISSSFMSAVQQSNMKLYHVPSLEALQLKLELHQDPLAFIGRFT